MSSLKFSFCRNQDGGRNEIRRVKSNYKIQHFSQFLLTNSWFCSLSNISLILLALFLACRWICPLSIVDFCWLTLDCAKFNQNLIFLKLWRKLIEIDGGLGWNVTRNYFWVVLNCFQVLKCILIMKNCGEQNFVTENVKGSFVNRAKGVRISRSLRSFENFFGVWRF